MQILKTLFQVALYTFASIGVMTTVVFVGMQYGLLNVRGSIIERNAFFGSVPTATSSAEEASTNGCATKEEGTACAWNETTFWTVVRDALRKDASVINRVSNETGVPARMIAAAVIPEQIRFFTDNREVFKRYFEPLKLLASLSKFSLGVSGIKQDTATLIEKNAIDRHSAFYPGSGMESLIAYAENTDHDTELFNRLTDEKDHYYSYLYTALYLKEIEAQWQNAGFDIHDRPDVLVTLFNLGFSASKPNANPKVAGAPITIGGNEYSFGYLGTLFYHSDELTDVFPQ